MLPYSCQSCTVTFHYRDDCADHMTVYGQTCFKNFSTWRACDQHMDIRDHWAPDTDCGFCHQQFVSRSAAIMHMNTYGHWPQCETCFQTFRSWRACDRHMDNEDHRAPRFGCETCDRKFHSGYEASVHMDKQAHWRLTVPCETCKLKFRNHAAAERHMREKAHYKNYCKPCNRIFQNENNLRMHLNSKLHRGNSIYCPFCKGAYTTASGLIHHLETGSCPCAPVLNREMILQTAREGDPHGVFTKKQIEWHPEENFKYPVTDYAYNGTCWECYICHLGFAARNSLNAHLNSPKHKQKVYRCPNSRKCGKEFTALAGVFGHLESEACAFMRFESVQQLVANVF